MESQPLIQLEGLTKTFGKGSKAVPAVVDLNLRIAPAQVYGFLGRNGAGKTTTIRLLLGLLHPTSGRAFIQDLDVQKDPRILDQVGSLVEDPQFYNFMSGRDNLSTLAFTSGKKPDERVDQLLELVGLTDRAAQRVSAYSKGMRQRLAIAAALLNDPQLVILDEPTNGLDPKGIQEIRGLIRGLVEKGGKTVFISSHLLSEVEQVCDRVAIIHQGRIIEEGNVTDLLSGQTGYLLIKAEPIQDTLQALRSDWEAKITTGRDDPGGEWIQVDAPPDAAPEIIRRLVGAKIDLHQVVKGTQKLEELFLELTGEEDSYE